MYSILIKLCCNTSMDRWKYLLNSNGSRYEEDDLEKVQEKIVELLQKHLLSGLKVVKNCDVITTVSIDGEGGESDSELPEVTIDDNGKVLMVVNGEWDKAELPELGTVQDVQINGVSIVQDGIASIDLSGKQDTLTPGDNINIENNIISAIDTVYSAGDNVTIDKNNLISAVNTTYSAGDNITINDNNVISAIDTVYQAGDNITIEDGVISAIVDTGITLTQAEYDALSEEEKMNGTYYISDANEGYVAGTGIIISEDNEISVANPLPQILSSDEGKSLIVSSTGAWTANYLPVYNSIGYTYKDGSYTSSKTYEEIGQFLTKTQGSIQAVLSNEYNSTFYSLIKVEKTKFIFGGFVYTEATQSSQGSIIFRQIIHNSNDTVEIKENVLTTFTS